MAVWYVKLKKNWWCFNILPYKPQNNTMPVSVSQSEISQWPQTLLCHPMLSSWPLENERHKEELFVCGSAIFPQEFPLMVLLQRTEDPEQHSSETDWISRLFFFFPFSHGLFIYVYIIRISDLEKGHSRSWISESFSDRWKGHHKTCDRLRAPLEISSELLFLQVRPRSPWIACDQKPGRFKQNCQSWNGNHAWPDGYANRQSFRSSRNHRCLLWRTWRCECDGQPQTPSSSQTQYKRIQPLQV